ncbi:MAG: 2Fe-2S iron-sulfur cluster binding domain-containing protein [Elusimicrobia bacterium]|nr:2Fe-2S iron-sulfur cluster binding domain-containing protein [Elusimicrobiota bacterium]
MKSNKTVEWDARFASILECAEGNGIQIDNVCRVGICGTCKVKLLSGEVQMETQDGLQDEDRAQNMILTCVAVPKTDVSIDA